MTTLTDILAQARQQHQAGNLLSAEMLYRQILQYQPDQPDYIDAYLNLGVLLRQQRRLQEAEEVYRRALGVQPGNAVLHNNLGNVYRDQERLDQAVRCYEQALLLAPQYPEALNNLAIALQELGQTERAVSSLREALRIRPDYAQAHNNLGVILAGLGQIGEARVCYQQAALLQPDSADAHQYLGLLYHAEGRLEKATAQFGEVLRLRPEDPTAKHLFNALTGAVTPARPSAEYVASLFDAYAKNFDHHVKGLGYCGPELLQEALADLAASKDLDILDLGCGTGLCGVVFKPRARTLTGVDLASKMLAMARTRALYDQLIQGDLLIPLHAAQDAFDLIVASDVFTYLGNLGDVFHAASLALRPGGRLAFVAEALENEGVDYVLRPSGRFAHSATYLRRLAQTNNFTEVSMKKAIFRSEREKGIDSLVVVIKVAKRPGGNAE